MNEGGKKGGKKSFDIMAALGLVIGLGLMVFGIAVTMPPEAPVMPTEEYYGEDTDAYNDAMDAYNKALAGLSGKEAEFTANGGFFQLGNLNSFIDVPSLAITVGGCFAALMVAFPMSEWAKFPKWLSICFTPNKYDPQDRWPDCGICQGGPREGPAEAGGQAGRGQRPVPEFSSLMLVVDSVEPEKVHNLLQAELDKMDERHGRGKSFMEQGGAFAPGFGMIGTLIGLINMLGSMSDPNSIGPAMATALLTTRTAHAGQPYLQPHGQQAGHPPRRGVPLPRADLRRGGGHPGR